MDEARAAEVLVALAEEVGDELLLWRGERLDGGDVDVVVTAAGAARTAAVLRGRGLAPAPQEPGRVLWRLLPSLDVVVDVSDDHAWPRMYPPLADVRARARRGRHGLPVAAVGDRALVHAAEGLAGWSWPRTAARLAACAADPTLAEGLARATTADPRLGPLADLVRRAGWRAPDAPEHLPLRVSAAVAARTPYARHALRSRLLGEPMATPPAVVAPPGGALVVALSGMDGAGKSTASLALLDRFAGRGEAAVVRWARLARDLGALEHLGRMVRRLLRRSRSVSTSRRPGDPTGPVAETGTGAPRRRGSPVDAAWVVVLALASVRAGRRAARVRRAGTHVVCDRWRLDAVVDLRIRYGTGHRVAEEVLRRGFPGPDVEVLLRLDPGEAARRKPGDQRPDVLAEMGAHYDDLAAAWGVRVLDAGRPSGEVVAELLGLVPDRS